MFKISDLAGADIEQIWLYISEQDIDSANKIIFEMKQKFEMLSSYPSLGKIPTGISPQIRSFPWKNYLIIYKLYERDIEITRILF